MADEQTLADATGIDKMQAQASLAELNKKFADLAAENGQLKRALMAQQTTLDKVQARSLGRGVPVERRHCNTCGADVPEGQRCKLHKTSKVNEIGIGMHHNRVQPFIIRQV
jgi:hypothetical protein